MFTLKRYSESESGANLELCRASFLGVKQSRSGELWLVNWLGKCGYFLKAL